MVRNYLLGYFLTTLDGPFHSSDWIKSLVTDELPGDFFETAVETVRSISAKELRDLAARYLAVEDMWEVVVGQSGQ
jgi:predicted Zn-dependent peptidase